MKTGYRVGPLLTAACALMVASCREDNAAADGATDDGTLTTASSGPVAGTSGGGGSGGGSIGAFAADGPPSASAAGPSATDAVIFAGTNADEFIIGTPDNDTLSGGGGDDEIIGGEGEDLIEGGDGNDLLMGDGAVDAPSETDAFRFLVQASFGGNRNDITALRTLGPSRWFREQLTAPTVSYPARVIEMDESISISVDRLAGLFWERAMYAEDQLRQRVAYALSQIVVVSLLNPNVSDRPQAFSQYVGILERQALGNYCDMIQEVSRNPAMGLYLSHLGNRKADPERESVPDENYAREVMQLFTIGLVKLDPQGRSLDAESYTVEDVQGLASVFTGFNWANTSFDKPKVNDSNRALPMQGFAEEHEPAPKTFLGATVNFGAAPEASMTAALDHLLANDNVAPFISRQLIQKMVTSNPSPGYVGRVATVFERGTYELPDGIQVGAARRCDMAATVAAILFDEEARDPAMMAVPTFGKVREPVLRFAHILRALRAPGQVSTSGLSPATNKVDDAEESDKLGQNAYLSPSVFNFYRPGFVVPGSLTASAGLVAPEMQLVGDNTVVGYINFVEDFLDSVPGANKNDVLIGFDFEPYQAIADQPALLLDRLDSLLTGERLTPETKERIIRAMEARELKGSDIDKDIKRRVEVAILMVVTSPEFMVQQ